jgi:hypothetical protein
MSTPVSRRSFALVEEVTAQLPAGAVSAADHSVAAGRDMNITASGGGTAVHVREPELTPAAHALQVGERQLRRRVVMHDTFAERDLEQTGTESKGIQEIEVGDRSICMAAP